jgi:hypothetical protein
LSGNCHNLFCGYDWRFNGFSNWLRNEVATHRVNTGADEDTDEAQIQQAIREEKLTIDVGINPDAYALDDTNKFVYCLEIVESNDIDDLKATKLANCFWHLDEAYWYLVVILFYPRQGRTMLMQKLNVIDGVAGDFEGRPHPYRDAFTALLEPAQHHLPEAA